MRELTREQVEYAVGRLVRLVESRGIKQTQLEQASEVNQSTISKIFSGWQEPGADKYTPSEEISYEAVRRHRPEAVQHSERI